MHHSISFVKLQRSSDLITMATQEFLEGVIEKVCLNKVEVGSKALKFCNKAIANGIAKYNGQFPLDVSYDDFILQVLCHVLRERVQLKNDMETVIAERDAFKTKVDELKIAKLKEEATAAQQRIDELEEAVAQCQHDLAKAVTEIGVERDNALSWKAQFENSQTIHKIVHEKHITYIRKLKGEIKNLSQMHHAQNEEPQKRNKELEKTINILEQQKEDSSSEPEVGAGLRETTAKPQGDDRFTQINKAAKCLQDPKHVQERSESASDDSASGVGGRDEGEKRNCMKKLPKGKHRFTVVVAAAKVAYPEAFKECLDQKVKCQNRKKEAAKLKKRYVEVQEELEMEENETKKGMLKRRLAYVGKQVKEKAAEASSLFKSGCEMANDLNTKVKEQVKSQDQQIKADIASTNRIYKTVRKLNDQVEAQKKARIAWDSNLTFEETLASVGDA